MDDLKLLSQKSSSLDQTQAISIANPFHYSINSEHPKNGKHKGKLTISGAGGIISLNLQ